jgi:NADH dehydrogenase [ubiquinone] 1 alpha subcomplex assembly factor 7
VSELDPDTQISTPLAVKIKALIRANGPMLIADYMQLCLHDPEHGYYRSQRAIGAQADFVTAPEISQVFGELIGIWAAVTWRAMGAPEAFNLAELGPGRGTLMKDVLRAGSVVPGFVDAASVHLIESNPTLVAQQKSALSAYPGRVWWHETAWALAADPRGRTKPIAAVPTIILANEFLDTIPIQQFVARNGQWQMRGVGLDGDHLVFSEDVNFAQWHQYDPTLPLMAASDENSIAQSTDGPVGIQQILSGRASLSPLAALFIDYGFGEPVIGDTLQAMSDHKHVSPFRAPGLDDLTAHVDFSAYSTALRSAALHVDGPITQTEFLLKMGLVERAQALMRQARPDQINGIETAARRIADPDGMGGLFKVMAIRSQGVPVLPPFAATSEDA